MVGEALFGEEEGGAAGAGGGDHGHSHGGEPCHGHGEAPAEAEAVPAEESHSHGHGEAPSAPTEEAHGHSHGGEPCHGHGEAPPAPKEEAHGHSHGGEPCHGHGHGGPRPMISKEALRGVFAAYATAAATAEFKGRLREAHTSGKDLDDMATLLQIEVISTLGLKHDPVIVLEMMERVFKVYGDDAEFQKEFLDHMEVESDALDEAELGPEEFAKKKAAAKETAQKSTLRDMQEIQMEMMKLKQMGMLMKMSDDEHLDTVKSAIEQMRAMIGKQPKMKEMVVQSLLQRGIDVGSRTDAEEILDYAQEQMFEMQAFAKAELEKETVESGSTIEEVLQNKMRRLTIEASIIGGQGHGHGGGHGHSHGGEPCHGHGGPPMPAVGGPLRFSLGTKVKCNMGPQGWHTGTIAAQWYSEPHWPDGQKAAYQVQLDSGSLIFAPMDSPQIINEA